MRFTCSSRVLSALLLCCVAGAQDAEAKPEKEIDAEELLGRAYRALDVRAKGEPPFELMAAVSIAVMPKDAPPGEWTLSWERPGRWHERFSVPGFTRLRASGDDGLWEHADPDRSFPLVSSLTAALDPIQFLELWEGDKVTGAERVRGGAGAVRIDIDRSKRHEAAVSVLINEDTGRLVAVERMDVANRFEYLDQVKVGKRFFPKTIRVRRGGNVHAVVTVQGSSRGDALKEDVLSMPKEGRPLMTSSCASRDMPILLEASKPVFPPEFEAEGVEGVVILDLEIDSLGRVSRVKQVRSDHWRLTEPVVTAARGRRYRPAHCDGEPAVAHVRMAVAHPAPTKTRAARRGRRAGHPNDGSDPLAGRR